MSQPPVDTILAALMQRMDEQQWPTHTLYVVATPIGNLADLSLRAWQALVRADTIAAEDTRTAQPLLQAWGVGTPVWTLHRHNEAQASAALIERLQQGQRVALISDAGAPAISDPGGRVVREVRAAGLNVVAVPGPSAVITALMGSGVTSDAQPAFLFAGFSPHKQAARQKWLQQWQSLAVPVVFFESPHRLLDCAKDIEAVFGPERELTICRELTKRFEQVVSLPAAALADWVAARPEHRRGEFVFIIHGAVASAQETALDETTQRWMRSLLTQMSVRDVVRVAQQATDYRRQELYDFALAQSQAQSKSQS